ncbi:DUF3524 domain-containing protein [candidate division KSB1 bacterium]
MRILALEPYYGGSHKAFLDEWSSRSRHEWTVLSLPPNKWKWRMRHAAVTFTEEAKKLHKKGGKWDLVFCSDMLNLAEFLGFTRSFLENIPSIVYFHENQISYPVKYSDERDYHFAVTNFTTALAADAVWFNSDFHRRSFLGDLKNFLKKMPDHNMLESIKTITAKSEIFYPGINEDLKFEIRNNDIPVILWAARWEYDKDPGTFFNAIEKLQNEGLKFNLNIIGEQFKNSPDIFDNARTLFEPRIKRWGFQETGKDYLDALYESDIIVSTAIHEFFGIGILEAVTSGVYPLLPERLSYPEIFSTGNEPIKEFFYNGGIPDLQYKLRYLLKLHSEGGLSGHKVEIRQKIAEKFVWKNNVKFMDDEVEKIGRN